MLIALWSLSWVWLLDELQNAPIYDEETGRFIYRNEKGW